MVIKTWIIAPYAVVIHIDGTTYKAFDTATGSIVSSHATDAAVVINYVIANYNTKRILIRAGTYLCGSSIVCVDKNFILEGERAAASGNFGQSGDTIIKANYTDLTTGIFLDCRNTVYQKQQFFNLIIDCDKKVAIGLHAIDIRERYPYISNLHIYNAVVKGAIMTRIVYTNVHNLIIDRCGPIGLHLIGPVLGTAINTANFHDCRIQTNDINIVVEGYTTDLTFNTCVLENNDVVTDNMTSCVKVMKLDGTGQPPYNIRFRDCSFEYFSEAPEVDIDVVDNDGINVTLDNCRFNAYGSYTPIHCKTNARSTKIINNQFQANNVGTTANIIIDSGAIGTRLIDNTQATATPLKVFVKDSGTKTVRFGNTFCSDTVHSSARKDKRIGWIYQGNNRLAVGLFSGSTTVGTVGVASFTSADPGRAIRYTSGTAQFDNAGESSGAPLTCITYEFNLFVKFRVNDITNSNVYIGAVNGSTSPAGDDPLNAASGFYFGKITTNANWVIMHNDGTGATVVDDTAIAADTAIHSIEIYADAANSKLVFILDGSNIFEVTSERPANGTSLQPMVQIEKQDAAAVGLTFDIFKMEIEST